MWGNYNSSCMGNSRLISVMTYNYTDMEACSYCGRGHNYSDCLFRKVDIALNMTESDMEAEEFGVRVIDQIPGYHEAQDKKNRQVADTVKLELCKASETQSRLCKVKGKIRDV